jgi:hypothetical protein
MRGACLRHARVAARRLSHDAATTSDAAEAFAALAAALPGSAPPGLYGVPGLRAPSDFTRLAQDAVHKCVRDGGTHAMHTAEPAVFVTGLTAS